MPTVDPVVDQDRARRERTLGGQGPERAVTRDLPAVRPGGRGRDPVGLGNAERPPAPPDGLGSVERPGHRVSAAAHRDILERAAGGPYFDPAIRPHVDAAMPGADGDS